MLKVWIKILLYDQTSASKSAPNCRQQFNMFLSTTLATVTTSISFELACSYARVTSIKSTKRQWVSQSYWVTDKHCQWSDSGPIKMKSADWHLMTFDETRANGIFFRTPSKARHFKIFGLNLMNKTTGWTTFVAILNWKSSKVYLQGKTVLFIFWMRIKCWILRTVTLRNENLLWKWKYLAVFCFSTAELCKT